MQRKSKNAGRLKQVTGTLLTRLELYLDSRALELSGLRYSARSWSTMPLDHSAIGANPHSDQTDYHFYEIYR